MAARRGLLGAASRTWIFPGVILPGQIHGALFSGASRHFFEKAAQSNKQS